VETDGPSKALKSFKVQLLERRENKDRRGNGAQKKRDKLQKRKTKKVSLGKAKSNLDEKKNT